MEGGKEVDGAAVVARGDVSEVFELVEEALDAVAQFVGDGVMRDLDGAIAFGGDDGLGSGLYALWRPAGGSLLAGVTVAAAGRVRAEVHLQVRRRGGRPGRGG